MQRNYSGYVLNHRGAFKHCLKNTGRFLLHVYLLHIFIVYCYFGVELSLIGLAREG